MPQFSPAPDPARPLTSGRSSAASNPPSYWLTRLCLQRAMGFIYLLAFWGTLQQFQALIGERGLQPVSFFLQRVHFSSYPSLFWLNSSDHTMTLVAWGGIALSLLVLSGLTERFGTLLSAAVWSLLWLFYLSFVNVGQTFYSFGWETMTLEAGFLAIFLGSEKTRSPVAVIWLYRWVLFRLMFGAGLIKLRGDSCWRDLSCMDYHYQTQPIPNPLSWYFHHLPIPIHRIEVLFTHFVEIIVPWGLICPRRRIRIMAGFLTVIFQAVLILSGNLSWLNYLTIVIAIACFDDEFWLGIVRIKIPATAAPSGWRRALIGALVVLVALLSIGPVKNLISPRQAMNASFEPLHLVNTYGAFGSITRDRNEIIIEGTDDADVGPNTVWKEYAFKGKSGDVSRMPSVIAPYHLRLDWLMWFAAMGSWRHYPWTLSLTARLLQNDPILLKQLAGNPFPEQGPHYIRTVLYRYRFTTYDEKIKTGNWWVRKPLGTYLPPLSLDNPELHRILGLLGWTSKDFQEA